MRRARAASVLERPRPLADEVLSTTAGRRLPLSVVVGAGAVFEQAKPFVQPRTAGVVLEGEPDAGAAVVNAHDDLFARFDAVVDELYSGSFLAGAGGVGVWFARG